MSSLKQKLNRGVMVLGESMSSKRAAAYREKILDVLLACRSEGFVKSEMVAYLAEISVSTFDYHVQGLKRARANCKVQVVSRKGPGGGYMLMESTENENGNRSQDRLLDWVGHGGGFGAGERLSLD